MAHLFSDTKHGVADDVLGYDPDRSTLQKHFRPRRHSYTRHEPRDESRGIFDRGGSRVGVRVDGNGVRGM